MGNSFGSKRKAVKVMGVDGTTFKLKPPVTAREALRQHPGYVLLDAEDVKRLGVRSTPLDPDQPLKHKKLYFLVELPKAPDKSSSSHGGRRVRSGLNMTAKDRLETLMLKRRAESDITSLLRGSVVEGAATAEGGSRVRVRLPKSQVAKLVKESGNSSEAAEKIVELCLGKNGMARGHSGGGGEKVQGGKVTGSGELISLKKEKRMRFAAQEPEIIG